MALESKGSGRAEQSPLWLQPCEQSLRTRLQSVHSAQHAEHHIDELTRNIRAVMNVVLHGGNSSVARDNAG